MISNIHDLDKRNFFYRTITTLAYTLFGVNELYSRGFITLKLHEFPIRSNFEKEIDRFEFPLTVKDQILRTRTFTPLIFVPGFTTKDKSRTYQMDPNKSAVHFIRDTRGRSQTNLELTYMTIILAWEQIQKFDLHRSPVKEFFRHIRNAAAHNGRFNFRIK